MARKTRDADEANEAAETLTPIAIEMPLGPIDPPGLQATKAEQGYIGDRGLHLDVRLGKKAARAFARLRNGLRESNARLPDGRPVWTAADTLRYLLEAIADADPSVSRE